MTLESHTPLDVPPLPSGADVNPNFKPLDQADQWTWHTAKTRGSHDSQAVMDRLGLSNFGLTDDGAGAQPGKSKGAETARAASTSTNPEAGPSSEKDASSPATGSHKPPPLPELVAPVTQPKSGAGSEAPHWEVPPPPADWVKPVEARPVTVDSARQSLERSADAQLSSADAAEFKANMQKFEARAKTDHLTDSQISLTYQNVNQLLNAKDGPVDSADRHRLAEQVIALSADPNKAVTGNESQTCGPAQLETLIYKNSPEKASNLVAQVAMSGSYTAADGTKVTPDSMPTAESRNPVDQYSRLYASQIFQTTALDVALKKEGSDLEYHHEIGDQETTRNAEYFTDSNGRRLSYEGTYPTDLLNAYQGITGKNDLTVISNDREADTDNIKNVHSAAQLKTVLDELHAKGDPPTIIGVDDRNQPFWDQNHADYPQGNEDPYGNYGHWAAIKGYDPSTGTISYHNGWDTPDHQIDINRMYRATQAADSNLPEMGKDFVGSLSSGRGNYAEAIDALRIRSETGRISDYDLNRLLDRDVQGLIRQRGAHVLDDQTDRKNIGELVNYLANRKALSLRPETQKALQKWWDAHPDQ